MTPFGQGEELKHTLEELAPVISVDEIKIENGFIRSLVIGTSTIGVVTVCRLEADDAPSLFALYASGLSEKSRRLFAPYPLFNTSPASADELAARIAAWKREDDWTALNMVKDNRIIGLGILKRLRTEQVTSGIMIADEYQGKSLGFLLQSLIVAQARLLKVGRFHIKVISDNQASVRLHEKCGFRWSRRLPPPLYEDVLQYLSEVDKKNGADCHDRHVMEMAIELESPTAMTKSLRVRDFTEAFGAEEGEVACYCGELLETLDFRYKECTPEAREALFLDAIKKYDHAELSVSGSHRLNDWRAGWGEILQEFLASGGDLKALVPKDLRPNRPLRYRGNYILPLTDSFEHDFALVFRYWLFKKYCKDYPNIYEFGCGTGQNLAVMAGLFPEKRFFGMDWVPESQELLKSIARTYEWQIEGHRFDLFEPTNDLEILHNSLVYTSCAMEQLGGDYGRFLHYLLAKKPSLCVNVECIQELYDEDTLYDYVALRYHRRRNYLGDFLTRLRALEQEKVVEIIATKRTGFGSLYHEGYMYVIWKIL